MGDLHYNEPIAPYGWTGSGFGEYTITVTVYDKTRNSQSQSMRTPYGYNVQIFFNLYQIQG
jgi:hypothetical protein